MTNSKNKITKSKISNIIGKTTRGICLPVFCLFSILAALCSIYPDYSSVYASDIQLEATVELNKIEVGQSLQLNLSIHGIQNIAAPELGDIDGFNPRYLGPSTMISVINGVMTSSITHIYRLTALKTGTFTLGPFSVKVQNKTITSQPIIIEVVPASSQKNQSRTNQTSQNSSTTEINQEELKDRIFLTLTVGKRKAYLNEIIPITIKLYVNQLGVRDIQLPVLDSNDFSLGKFATPKQYKETIGQVIYDVIEFTTEMFAIKSGEFSLGPAKLNCNLVVQRQSRRRPGYWSDDFFDGFFNDDIFDNFFGRYETYPLELKSAPLPINALPLPQEEKPADFNGALGNFQLTVETAPLEVKAGDPLTLKMTIIGNGNFDSVNVPQLQSKDGFKVYDPQIKQENNKKIFEQILIPDSEKITHVPRINFSFFNTQTGQYQVLTHEPIPITVVKTQEPQVKLVEPLQNQTAVKQKEELGRDIIYLKNSPGTLRKINSYLYQSFGFWSAQTAVIILFLIIIFFHLERQKLITDPRYARRLRALAKAKKGIQRINKLSVENNRQAFFDAIFKTLREYLADRFHLAQGGITAMTIEEIAQEKGISADILDKIKKIFTDCDMARYAPSQFGLEQLEDILKNLKEVIDYLERQKV
jgi:hypothetical protein